MKRFIPLTLLLVSVQIIANGQNVGTGISAQVINVVVKNVFDMNLNSGKTVTFSFDKFSDYDSGVEALNANTVGYKTNQAWKVNVKALTKELTGGADLTSMPAGVIMVRQNGAKEYFPLSVIDQEIARGTRGASSFNIDYKANPGYSFESGTYGITLQYTITNQ